MNRIYKYQRHFYDLTRPLFLLGRNRLIASVKAKTNDTVLEMGCGTARNLIHLAKNNKTATFFGVDTSWRMLETAEKNIRRAGFNNRIFLKEIACELVRPNSTFFQCSAFNHIIFSYSLSMMPNWTRALDATQLSLAPSGKVYFVDFGNFESWPLFAHKLLKKWFSLFHVECNPRMQIEISNRFPNAKIVSIFGGYAFWAYSI